jgi:hypothetical protein
MRSPAISPPMCGNGCHDPAQCDARVVDASVAWTCTTWLNIAFLILAILFVWRFPKTGDAATLR